MRKITIGSILLATLMLAGCTAGNEPPSSVPDSALDSNPVSSPISNPISSPDSNPSSSEPTPEDSVPPQSAELPFPLYCADGSRITVSEITSAKDKDGNAVAPEALEDTCWEEIVCDGFAFLAEPTVCLNSVDDTEKYDPEALLFDLPRYTDTPYKRVYVGDKCGELTVKSASTLFSRIGFEDKEGVLTTEQILAEGMSLLGMFRRCDVAFDGTVTMTGYMRVCVSEYGIEEGEVIFVPDKESMALPLLNFHLDYENDSFNTAIWQWNVNGFVYASEYPTIRLGNINDGIDISGVPTDGTSARVGVTVTDISMFCDTAMSSFIDGRLVGFEIL